MSAMARPAPQDPVRFERPDMRKEGIFTTAPTSLEMGSFGRKESRKQNPSSPSSPAGLSSAAVVNKKERM